MANPELSFRVEWHGRTALLAVAGEVDLLTAPSLVATIDRLLAERPQALRLDLGGVGSWIRRKLLTYGWEDNS